MDRRVGERRRKTESGVSFFIGKMHGLTAYAIIFCWKNAQETNGFVKVRVGTGDQRFHKLQSRLGLIREQRHTACACYCVQSRLGLIREQRHTACACYCVQSRLGLIREQRHTACACYCVQSRLGLIREQRHTACACYCVQSRLATDADTACLHRFFCFLCRCPIEIAGERVR